MLSSMNVRGLSASVGCCVAGAVAGQVPVAIANGSFDDVDIPFVLPAVDLWDEGGPVLTEPNPITGGTITGQLSTGVFDNTPSQTSAGKPGSDPEPNGLPPFPQAAFIRNDVGGGFAALEPVSLSQTLSERFLAGNTYRLTFSISESNSGFGPLLDADARLEVIVGYGAGSTIARVASREVTKGEIDFNLFQDLSFESSVVGPTGDAAGEPIVVVFRPLANQNNDAGTGTFELDNIRLARTPLGCAGVDVAEPFGELDIFDAVGMFNRFDDGDAIADLAAPMGVFDGADLTAIITAIEAGCGGR